MTKDEVIARVRKIAQCAGDPEGAHSMEDALYEDVLRAISKNDCGGDSAGLAAEALKVAALDFPRWCA